LPFAVTKHENKQRTGPPGDPNCLKFAAAEACQPADHEAEGLDWSKLTA
jgi:hypothetical protein